MKRQCQENSSNTHSRTKPYKLYDSKKHFVLDLVKGGIADGLWVLAIMVATMIIFQLLAQHGMITV